MPVSSAVPAARRTGPARRTPRAFSLIELLIVLAIVAVVGTIAVPRYARASARYSAEFAARRVAADLELARRSAMAASTAYTVTFTPATSKYQFGKQGAASPDSLVDLSAEPYRVTIGQADFAGAAVVTFDGFGVPNTGGDIRVLRGDRSYAVKVYTSGATEVLRVN